MKFSQPPRSMSLSSPLSALSGPLISSLPFVPSPPELPVLPFPHFHSWSKYKKRIYIQNKSKKKKEKKKEEKKEKKEEKKKEKQEEKKRKKRQSDSIFDFFLS